MSSTKEKKIEFVALRNDTLLNLIKDKLKDYSNKTIKQYIKNKMVEVDGTIEVNPNTEIINNAVITFYFNKNKFIDTPFEIIYEDDDIIVINKPSGLLSISNDKEHEMTAFRLVSDYIKTKNKNDRIFVVHRLDEDTSGILMFAKNMKIKNKLQENWNDLVKVREYQCVIPCIVKESGTIESYLTMKNQMVYSTKNKEIGWYAKTNYEPIRCKDNYTLLKVCIDTGKRNQIRVHMKENFKPICGDKKYGSKDNPIKRLCLHATKLVIVDPRTNKEITFKSNIPQKMKHLVK